jgi:antitoxin Phd
MEISINSLVSIEKAINEAEAVFKSLDEIGRVIVLKDNKPAYVLLKYEENVEVPVSTSNVKATYTLQEAMRIVLSEAENHTLHASELADIIYDRKLYLQKNGEKAKANQMRARCGHYPDMFEALPGNYIRLKQS